MEIQRGIQKSQNNPLKKKNKAEKSHIAILNPTSGSPETNSHIYGQLIVSKDDKTIQWGKSSFEQRALRQLVIYL